ncbi:hypothetical protein L6452_14148 [Arctium lappa]|uniref:Uncharacterized protein n=1 Tax=Arctium lappa TaxID=4217 RepID=A0ACB9CKH9_ARCLA|nr:hypothetical protein L6452_14148 [Arctium lappa]
MILHVLLLHYTNKRTHCCILIHHYHINKIPQEYFFFFSFSFWGLDLLQLLLCPFDINLEFQQKTLNQEAKLSHDQCS